LTYERGSRVSACKSNINSATARRQINVPGRIELGVFDFALAALPNERKTSTNGGTLAPALSMKALVS
jgi:hypothetical protein